MVMSRRASWMVTLIIGLAPAVAQAAPGDPVSLAQKMEDQDRLIATQSARIEEQAIALSELRERLDAITAGFSNPRPTSGIVIQSDALAASATPPGAGSFPGSVLIPGTDLSVKLTGFFQAGFAAFPGAAPGEPEEAFLLRAISTADEPAFEEARSRFTARETRLGLDVRSPSKLGSLRGVFEIDFAGNIVGNAQNQVNPYDLRLRQAVIEIGPNASGWSSTFGQTWSAFADPSAYGEGFNPIPYASVFVRQPQLRITKQINPSLTASVSFENPQGDLSGATGAAPNEQHDTWPDIVGQLRLKRGTGHLQLGLLARHVRETEPNGREELGFGASISGVAPLRVFGTRDLLKFQVVGGRGIGRYIADLGVGTGADGFLLTERATLTDILSGYVAFQHHWTPSFRSNILVGRVMIDNPKGAGVASVEQLSVLQANTVFQASDRVSFAVEGSVGERVDEGGDSGTAGVLLLVAKYVL